LINVDVEEPHQSVSFNYIKRLSDIRLVFTARTKQEKDVIVKFGSGHYGVKAHQEAFTAGLAPAILSYSHLPGGMWMVVMEPLENNFKPCDEFNELSDSLMKAVSTSLDRFHALGYVHGDLRDSNVFVRKCTGPSNDVTWECKLIDYDWAGREGDVKYPLGVYCNDSVWRPEKYMDGKLITAQGDRQMVEEFFNRRAMVRRF
jgi:serine/threonine protein kinase